MSVRAIFGLALLWVLSLFAVASVAKAQVFELPRPLPEPTVVAGPDFGFRVEGDQRGTPVGKLVVRIDGKWIEARIASGSGPRRISSR
jgi:hypothetical protein